MGRGIRTGVAIALFSCTAPALAADPVLMFLLSAAREAIAASMRRAPAEPAYPAPPADVYPGTMVQPADIRRLIDEGFGYLTDAQREEIFAALHAGLLDPRNAGVRASMIEYFADRALTVRAARERLARLSQREKEQLASDFRSTLGTLPPEEAERMVELLRGRLLPLPADLNDMLLGAAQS